MNRWIKRIAAAVFAAAVVILTIPTSPEKAYAVGGYTISFSVNPTSTSPHAFTMDGTRLIINGGIVEPHLASNTAMEHSDYMVAVDNANNTATMTINDDQAVVLNFSGDTYSLFANGQPISPDTVISASTAITVQDPVQNPGQNPGPDTNHSAKITLSALAGSKTVLPEDHNEGDGPVTISYSRTWTAVQISMSDSRNDHNRTQSRGYEPQDEDGNTTPVVDASLATQSVGFNRENTDTTVPMTLFLPSWGDRLYGLTINGTDYSTGVHFDVDGDGTADATLAQIFDDRYTWLCSAEGQGVYLTIPDVAVNEVTDAEGTRDEYAVAVAIAPNEHCYVGNFLWSNDDYFAPDGQNPSDVYIGHSDLTLLSVDFNDGDPAWDFDANGMKHVDLSNATDEGSAVFQGKTLPYVHYQLDRMSTAASATEVRTSEMLIPEGAWVTMKIEPHYGYQVKSFEVNNEDINLSTQSVFSFRVGKGNFHLGADVSEVENDVRVDSDVVANAAVELADNTLDYGSARLYVEDAKLSGAKKTEFEEEAKKEGVEIQSVVNMTLDQVFYKGTGNDDDVWATEMNDLTDPATIYLQIDGANGAPISALHNIHDGENYEMIEGKYLPELGEDVYGFQVGGFSNFAIVKGAKSNAAATTATTANKAPRTGDAASPARAVLILGLAALGVVLTSKKVRK